MKYSQPIIFYDGSCPLCHFAVKWLYKIDHRRVLMFAPLQGPTAKELLSNSLIEANDTVVLYFEEKQMIRSEAIITALKLAAPQLLVTKILSFLPGLVLDLFYRIIAYTRSCLGNTEEVCPIPEARDQRFLP